MQEGLEWSSLAEAPRTALRQWVQGQLGGRHCMLVLQHGASADSMLSTFSNDDPSLSDARGPGASLNVLAGLQAEAELIGCSQEGGWLFEEVFSKTPAQMLEEALAVAIREIGDPSFRHPGDLSAEQANLALRRRAMKALCNVGVSDGDAASSRGADEYTRTQVWLELLRLHVEGPGTGARVPPAERAAPAGASKDRKKAGPPEEKLRPWDDRGVMEELGKAEGDIEAESQNMSLENLRDQNRHIEEYMVRLVRQKDELKHAVKVAEERDAYCVLGLEGPSVSDEVLKKAYRNLARQNHPDKAGDKKRFQAIQHAYTSVQRQRAGGAGAACAAAEGEEQPSVSEDVGVSPAVTEAKNYAAEAMKAADRAAACAHRSMKINEDAADLQNGAKRRAVCVLRELTKKSTGELQGAARHLRGLGESVSNVARCADMIMSEHVEWGGKSVAGVGLRDRAIIVEDAGRSGLSTAELLEKIGEATEATLQKVERASPEGGGEGKARGGRDEAANLLRLGVRLLGESLARTSTVARRSADEAIGAAIKALELSRGLAALDHEARKEREKAAAKARGWDDEPVAAGDAPRGSAGAGGSPGGEADGEGEKAKTPRPPEPPPEQTPRDQLKSAAKRVKERHVALRVKNLRFLSTLNEEAMRQKTRLRSMLEQSEGAMLPEVSIAQKARIFDLATQLLDSALADATRASEKTSAPPARILERTLGFALVLEHNKEVALPVDPRTQALKLAALLDADLLCQMVDGPLRKRLLAAGGSQRPPRRPEARSQSYLRSQGSQAFGGPPGASGAKAWEDSVQATCSRIVLGIKGALVEPPPERPGC